MGISFVHWLVVLSAIISVSGASVYIVNTYRGKTQPNLVSWFMWALAPLIGTGAAISAHADPWTTVRIFLAGFLPLLVIIAVFARPQAKWKLTTFDLMCGICSFIALIVWLVIDMPRVAILFAVAGDAFAAIPTIIKSWKYPETETGTAYITSLIAVLLVLPSIPNWNIENSAFQIYLIFCNVILVLAVYRKKFKF